MSEIVDVQYYPCGHVDWSDDPEIVAKSKGRRQEGFLDALTLPSSECDICKEARSRQAAQFGDYDLEDES